MKRIMVVHPVADPLQVPFLHGISKFAREQKSWVLQINPEMHTLGLRHLERWPGDGVIASLNTPKDAAAAKFISQPMVNLSGAIRDTGVPRVMVDQAAMGRLAAEHLMTCGLSHFAYYGEKNIWYSELRKRGFVERLAQEGRPCSILEWSTSFNRRHPWFKWLEPLEQWLRTLPLPIGVLTSHDYAGTVVIETCLGLGLRVPEDMAVMATGNDVITCDFCEVPLSSVARNSSEVGYQAAALLDRLMAGQAPPEADILVPPEGVVQRRSTEIIAVSDPQIAAAVKYIHEHLADTFSVEMVGKKVTISRRAFDIRFQNCLGCTPGDYIAQKRVDRAKRLLLSKERLKQQQIANACGFSGPRHFREVFHRVTGMSPSEYRQRNGMQFLD
ncbi:MAG: DNA-binding transcriptional regulator [Pirellulales bacterium]|nr:DNA-binding transcriptional regulator [Pirellulales bacterium]